MLPAQRAQLAHAKSGEEGGPVERPVAERQHREELRGLLGRGDSLAAAFDGGKREPLAGVHHDRAVVQRSPEDHAEGHQGVPDRRGTEPGGEQLVDDQADVAALDVGQLARAERRQEVRAKHALVGTHDARLVAAPGPRPNGAAHHPADELVGGLFERRRPRRAKLAALDVGDGRSPPVARGRDGREGSVQLLPSRALKTHAWNDGEHEHGAPSCDAQERA